MGAGPLARVAGPATNIGAIVTGQGGPQAAAERPVLGLGMGHSRPMMHTGRNRPLQLGQSRCSSMPCGTVPGCSWRKPMLAERPGREAPRIHKQGCCR